MIDPDRQTFSYKRRKAQSPSYISLIYIYQMYQWIGRVDTNVFRRWWEIVIQIVFTNDLFHLIQLCLTRLLLFDSLLAREPLQWAYPNCAFSYSSIRWSPNQKPQRWVNFMISQQLFVSSGDVQTTEMNLLSSSSYIFSICFESLDLGLISQWIQLALMINLIWNSEIRKVRK